MHQTESDRQPATKRDRDVVSETGTTINRHDLNNGRVRRLEGEILRDVGLEVA